MERQNKNKENQKANYIKNLSPSWFASVMGTGIFAIALMLISKQFPILKNVSNYLFYFNVFLFFILIIPWLLRWILYPKESINDFKHPINTNFYATMPFGMLILAANFIIIGKNLFFGEIFWFVGSILMLLFALITTCMMFRAEHVNIEHLNPAWFIPPVGLIVIPIAGTLILGNFTGMIKDYIIIMNIVGFGTGFFSYIALLAVMTYRFILHTPLKNTLAPTIWINLGPVGAGSVSLIKIAQYIFPNIKQILFVLSFIFWSFGIWWLIISIMMTLHYKNKIKLPFALSWWAFTFPLGAYITASFLIAKIFNNILINYIGMALLVLLSVLWTLTLIYSVKNTINKKLFL